MARSYRRNDSDDDLIPPHEAFSGGQWEDIKEFAESSVRVAATDIAPWLDRTGKNDFYVDAGDDDDGERYAVEYLWPRREPLADWDEALVTEGVWMVYFASLQNPSRARKILWDRVYRSNNTVMAYDGVRMSKAYLFRGTGEEAEEFATALRAATLDWVQGEEHNVVSSGAYTTHDETEYVRVYDSRDPEDITAIDGRMVVLQDEVFGWWWYMADEGDYETDEAGGPYETERGADRAAERAAADADGRNSDERHMSADEVYLNRQADPEEEMPHRESVKCTRLHGTIAVVYQPKLKELLRVEPDGTRFAVVRFGSATRGRAYLDTESMGDCARTHSPGSGVAVGTGDGMALYTGLATLAYQACERECIGSCPASSAYGSRSGDADRWWAAARARGLAQEQEGGCDSITLQDLIDAGLVFWMESPGDYAGAILEAQEKYAAAFAAADPDPTSLEVIASELEQLLSGEDFEAWKAAHMPASGAALTANRRRRRKPAFVTPELEAHVEELYAGLEGL